VLTWSKLKLKVRQVGRLIWFVAPCTEDVTEPDRHQEIRFRMSGVLQEQDGRWLFRMWNGARPG
jgi:hypothetical protein